MARLAIKRRRPGYRLAQREQHYTCPLRQAAAADENANRYVSRQGPGVPASASRPSRFLHSYFSENIHHELSEVKNLCRNLPGGSLSIGASCPP